MKKSVFFKRTLALILSAVIFTSLLSAFLYMTITRNTYVNIRGQELTLVARSIAGFTSDTDDDNAIGAGFIFSAIANENTNFVDASVYVLDEDATLVASATGKTPSFRQAPKSEFFHRSGDETGSDTTDDEDAAPAEGVNSEDIEAAISSESDSISQSAEGNSLQEASAAADTASPPEAAASSESDINSPTKNVSIGSKITTGFIADQFAKVSDGDELITTSVNPDDNVEYLVVGVPIVDDTGQYGGAVIITKPVDELSDRLGSFNKALIISALITCLIMVIPAFIAGKRLTDPINDMRSVAQAMSSGDFSVRANENQAGEIGELAASINDFAVKSEKLEQTRRDYVANISHELKTPVASIRAMGETLRDGLIQDEDKKQRYYNHILQESLRLSRLVDDLLELSRLQSGNVALKCSDIDLLPVLENAAITFEQIAEDSGIVFKFIKPVSLPTVHTNADRINQVLVVLIDNAIKHTPDDGTVTLSAALDGDVVSVNVTDTGEGISGEDLPHVFERFYKSDKSHSGTGTGLGLSIAKEVLANMGESISVFSVPGQGSTFTITVHTAK